jgi:hypothetical protein
MSSAQRAVRGATAHPAVLLNVAETTCSGPRNTRKCSFEVTARIATTEQPVFTGTFPKIGSADNARTAYVVGATTTVYQLSSKHNGHLYYTSDAFEELKDESEPLSHVLLFIPGLLFIIGGARSKWIDLRARLVAPADDRQRDDL